MNSLLTSSLRVFQHTSTITTTTKSFNLLHKQQQRHFLFISSKFKSPQFISSCSSSSNGSNNLSDEAFLQNDDVFHSEVANPQVRSFNSPKLNFSDQAFFLLAFIACTVWQIFCLGTLFIKFQIMNSTFKFPMSICSL